METETTNPNPNKMNNEKKYYITQDQYELIEYVFNALDGLVDDISETTKQETIATVFYELGKATQRVFGTQIDIEIFRNHIGSQLITGKE